MTSSDDSVKQIQIQEPHLLSEILYDEFSVKAKEFKTLLEFGAIYVNDERQAKDGFIFQGSEVRVHLSPRRYHCNFAWKSLVIFENDFCLVLNKPAGVPSHPTVDNLIENALTQTSLAKNIPLFVTHRLDTLTSGLIVYGKKQSFVKSFNIQLQEKTTRKKYVALIETSQKLDKKQVHYMNPAPGRPKKLSNEAISDWDICELEVLEQKEISENLSLVKINLLTGRTHQIRAQMSHLKAPIKGDVLYGSTQPYQKDAIALRSCEVEFNCNEERLKFSINEDFI